MTVAVLMSAGWLAPAALGVDSVLKYLNEDMARLSLLRSARPGSTLPTEFNAAPNIIRAREQFGFAAAWLALVIVGWSVYVVRARSALQAAQQLPPGERLGEHERALETHFTEFAHEIDRHRRELSSEFGLVSEAAGGVRGVVQGRFDAVDARLAEVDAALVQRLDALNTLAARIDDSVQAAQAQRADESAALRETLQTVAGQLTEQIHGARTDSETQHRSDQDQRFISIHNAVQVLGAQVDDKLKSTLVLQEAAQAEQLGRFEASVKALGAELTRHQAGTSQAVQDRLDQQHERLAGQLNELDEHIGSTAQALQAQLIGSLESGLANRFEDRLAAGEQQQEIGREAQLAAVQALSAQLGEALQLQRDAGSEARRRAEAAIEARQATQSAQTQALAELASQVSRLGELARTLHEERGQADAQREQALLEQVDALMTRGREVLLARSDAAQTAWVSQAAELGQVREASQAALGLQEEHLGRLAELQDRVTRLGQQVEQGLAASDQQRQAEQAGWWSAVQGLGRQVAQEMQTALADRSAEQGAAFQQRHETLQQTLQNLSGQLQAQSDAADLQRTAAERQQRQALVELAAQLGSQWREVQAEQTAQARQAVEASAEKTTAWMASQMTAQLAGQVAGQTEHLAQVRHLSQQMLEQQAAQLDLQRAQQARLEALQVSLQQMATQADAGWRQVEQQQRSEWQLHGDAMRSRLDALGAELQAARDTLGGLQTAAAERPLDRLQGELQTLSQRVLQFQAATEGDRREHAAERQQAWQALSDRLGGELQSVRQAMSDPSAARMHSQEQTERLAGLHEALAQLGERVDAQREAWLETHRAEQAGQLQALQALTADLDRSLHQAQAAQAAQSLQAQQQERRLGELHALVQRLDEQQQSSQQHRQAEQGAMMLALERRLAAIDTLEAQVERLEGLLTRAGVQGVAARLSGIEAILSANGPTLLDARLRKLEELLTSTSQSIDGRLGDLHGLVSSHGSFQETGPASMAERGIDERRLQQLCLNLSDLQENLRLERRQLRKKAESLSQPLN